MNLNSKHNEYIDTLVEKLKGQYSSVEKNIEYYYKQSCVAGEIDLIGYNIGYKGNSVDIYEVKCNRKQKTIIKGLKQLRSAKRYFKKYYNNINLYLYFGNEDALEKIVCDM